MKSVLLLSFALFSLYSFAAPSDKCKTEARYTAPSMIQSQFEGNERLDGKIKYSARAHIWGGGFTVTAVGVSYDYHRLAERTPYYQTTVTLKYDKECTEVSRSARKKFLRYDN